MPMLDVLLFVGTLSLVHANVWCALFLYRKYMEPSRLGEPGPGASPSDLLDYAHDVDIEEERPTWL